MSAVYTIKELAGKTGVSVYTLRYYEKIGLLDRVERAANGHRRYGEAAVRRLDFLRRLKATGMPVSEMARYVELFRQGEPTITERRVILEAHRRQVEAQLEAICQTLALLDSKIENYRAQEQQLAASSDERIVRVS